MHEPFRSPTRRHIDLLSISFWHQKLQFFRRKFKRNSGRNFRRDYMRSPRINFKENSWRNFGRSPSLIQPSCSHLLELRHLVQHRCSKIFQCYLELQSPSIFSIARTSMRWTPYSRFPPILFSIFLSDLFVRSSRSVFSFDLLVRNSCLIFSFCFLVRSSCFIVPFQAFSSQLQSSHHFVFQTRRSQSFALLEALSLALSLYANYLKANFKILKRLSNGQYPFAEFSSPPEFFRKVRVRVSDSKSIKN